MSDPHPVAIWLIGLSGAGKSTTAQAIAQQLAARVRRALVLDGDELRSGINVDLGFSREDRLEAARRTAHMSALVAGAGVVPVTAMITPYARSRDDARAVHERAGVRYFEVWIATPIEVCASRDHKGLYAAAKRGQLPRLTGVADPFEEPAAPDLVLDASSTPAAELARRTLEAALEENTATPALTLSPEDGGRLDAAARGPLPLSARYPRRGRRQTLTLSISTRDAEARLPLLLAEARRYADEIVVGVDQASTDGTWDVAVAGADRVFGFVHAGVPSSARMAGLERASCDWILYLDDDEGMDAAFPELRDELLGAEGITNWWLPRKWLTSFDPPEYLHAEPWWPGWALRLARADTSRIWKPHEVHTGLRVIGPRGMESRTSILHYERIDRSVASRRAKVAVYRGRGQGESVDRYYADDPDAPRAAVSPLPLRDPDARLPGRAPAAVDDAVEDLGERQAFPPWGAEVSVEMPDHAKPGEVLLVTARARNTGTLRWECSNSLVWPDLALTYRVRCADGTVLPDRSERSRVGRDVLPGESMDFVCKVHVPQEPGEYVLEWQMLSELEHWFDSLGSPTESRPLTVVS